MYGCARAQNRVIIPWCNESRHIAVRISTGGWVGGAGVRAGDDSVSEVIIRREWTDKGKEEERIVKNTDLSGAVRDSGDVHSPVSSIRTERETETPSREKNILVSLDDGAAVCWFEEPRTPFQDAPRGLSKIYANPGSSLTVEGQLGAWDGVLRGAGIAVMYIDALLVDHVPALAAVQVGGSRRGLEPPEFSATCSLCTLETTNAQAGQYFLNISAGFRSNFPRKGVVPIVNIHSITAYNVPTKTLLITEREATKRNRPAPSRQRLSLMYYYYKADRMEVDLVIDWTRR
ncbi:hypothetical protein BDQ17DRAFT_1325759 [Cyathus striatus]|nr:hypothetical protein BDQ17DRAFT_1325759 [Cyathus striatus]